MIVTLEIKPGTKLKAYLIDAERAYLVSALQRSAGNVSQASRTTGINRTHLFALMAKHGLTDYARGLRLARADVVGAACANQRPDLAYRNGPERP